MDFFKRKVNEGSDEKDTKLVGAVVPTNISYYLNLFCVVDKRSKSSILRPLIEDWYEEAIEDFPEEQLIKMASEIGFDSYKNRKNKKRPFTAVLAQQERELKKKGISSKHIKKIINRIDTLRLKDRAQSKIKRMSKLKEKDKE